MGMEFRLRFGRDWGFATNMLFDLSVTFFVGCQLCWKDHLNFCYAVYMPMCTCTNVCMVMSIDSLVDRGNFHELFQIAVI